MQFSNDDDETVKISSRSSSSSTNQKSGPNNKDKCSNSKSYRSKRDTEMSTLTVCPVCRPLVFRSSVGICPESPYFHSRAHSLATLYLMFTNTWLLSDKAPAQDITLSCSNRWGFTKADVGTIPAISPPILPTIDVVLAEVLMPIRWNGKHATVSFKFKDFVKHELSKKTLGDI
ncbi:hypothetical protein GQX74_013717 [Glossina fuscipes]|nr:hypothetical protein GQX74_013717 [Glossina fuscipes]